MPGWQKGLAGWSIGSKGSGAPIEIDQPLGECHVGVFVVGYQILIWGNAKELPSVWLLPEGRLQGRLVTSTDWVLCDREALGRVALGGGDVRVRFDNGPLRFGDIVFERLPEPEIAGELCAFCNQPLQSYFRVGSQPACAVCAEKFKREKRETLRTNYRNAVLAGIAATIVGGASHAALVAFARISFGIVLIGLVIGIVMRTASRESADTQHRVIAVLLTFVAGSPQWLWINTLSSGVYLLIGMVAAWIVVPRNVQTEIHGPFQSKSA